MFPTRSSKNCYISNSSPPRGYEFYEQKGEFTLLSFTTANDFPHSIQVNLYLKMWVRSSPKGGFRSAFLGASRGEKINMVRSYAYPLVPRAPVHCAFFFFSAQTVFPRQKKPPFESIRGRTAGRQALGTFGPLFRSIYGHPSDLWQYQHHQGHTTNNKNISFSKYSAQFFQFMKTLSHCVTTS